MEVRRYRVIQDVIDKRVTQKSDSLFLSPHYPSLFPRLIRNHPFRFELILPDIFLEIPKRLAPLYNSSPGKRIPKSTVPIRSSFRRSGHGHGHWSAEDPQEILKPSPMSRLHNEMQMVAVYRHRIDSDSPPCSDTVCKVLNLRTVSKKASISQGLRGSECQMNRVACA